MMSKTAKAMLVISVFMLVSIDAFSIRKKSTVGTSLNVWSMSNPLIKNNPHGIHMTTWYTNYHNPTDRKVTYNDDPGSDDISFLKILNDWDVDVDDPSTKAKGSLRQIRPARLLKVRKALIDWTHRRLEELVF